MISFLDFPIKFDAGALMGKLDFVALSLLALALIPLLTVFLNQMKSRLLTLLALGVVGFLFWSWIESRQTATPTKPGPVRPVPPRRQPHVLLFTQAGCAPCEQEKKELAGLGVEEIHLPSPQARKYKISATPTLVAVGAGDKELARKVGFITKAEFETWLASLPDFKEEATTWDCGCEGMPGFRSCTCPRGNCWCVSSVGAGPGTPVVGGKTSPDGKAEIVMDLPVTQKFKNQGGSDGAGLCVFASITWAARWQNERTGFDLFTKMRKEPGGGYPEKVDAMLAKYCQGGQYLQDTTGDQDLLETILHTGRAAGVTYDGHDPHYGSSIAHMVDCVYFDRKIGWAAISDNNFIGDDEIVWMSCEEFVKRWKGGGGGGWLFCWLSPPPPPVPHN